MSAQGFPVSIAGVAQAYEDFLDTLVADVSDQALAGTLPAGVEVHFTNILMKTAEDRVHLAKAVRAASESSDRALSRA
jgi:2-phospho-L-lactate transferase/gluconeogenesis factor (CofD/UPF0052 family)